MRNKGQGFVETLEHWYNTIVALWQCCKTDATEVIKGDNKLQGVLLLQINDITCVKCTQKRTPCSFVHKSGHPVVCDNDPPVARSS